MPVRPMEIFAASAIAVCCLALAIHHQAPPFPAEAPAAPLPLQPSAAAQPSSPTAARPRIDVVFVLDTTGSMSGLLEGAKQRIWAIANRLAAGQPQPELRIGLVAYRDRGDDYVTRRFEFSSDMDAVYAELLSYTAGGGGDHPEHVGQGLEDALGRMQWTGEPNTLRLVFLVGDAPPHDDYQDAPSTADLAARAAQRGILINTVQCGDSGDTADAWRRIAALTGGEYTRIAQDGGTVTVATPYDQRLWQLNNELAATVLNWGGPAAKQAANIKLSNRLSMSASAAAEAASYSARTARMNEEDLLGALAAGQSLADIPAAELPDALQGMSPAEQTRHLDALRARREQLNETIRAVSAERDAFLRDAERAAGAGDGFDGQVTEILRRQAASLGVAY